MSAPVAGSPAALDYLRAGHTLTSNEALSLFGMSRLASAVDKWKRRGIPVTSEMVEVQRRDGRPVLVARYRLGGDS